MNEIARPRVRLAALLTVLLAGCVVGPNYTRPAAGVDAAFVNAGASAPNAAPVGEGIAQFWRGFADPLLSDLVERGIAANGDVRIARARLQEARASQAEADVAALPGAALDGGATRSIRPVTQQPGASRSERTGNVFDAGFIANWELDLFGRHRRGSEAAGAQAGASMAGVGAAQTAVAAEIARNYLELRGLQLRRAVAVESLANQREGLRIAEARFDAGRTTELDVARARTLVANTEASLPALQTAAERAVFRLATLSAQSPRIVLDRLAPPAPLPGLPVLDLATLPIGTPEQWLARRPDIVAAERRLAAATAGVGIATADLFPRLSLSGLLGLNAATIGHLGRSESAIYSLGIGIAWTPFDFGRLRARVDASEARAAQGLADYEQTIALALEQTEGAFSGFNRSAERAQRLDAAARNAAIAARLARVRYDAGATDFLVVLDAEREVLASRDQLVAAQAQTATALVAVYRALGGGWAPAADLQAGR
ncbi:MAG TPA: efflux transporter outer membrane subunit [Caldimonas sp.]|jgi:multidrug efflux system outer membrane protein|nr:efflux transporter outer membrane subunit [Caldimonas sp.]HEX2541654.1 efflux transporter outer membrane subunit [Caldimonas sp.]